MWRGSDSRESIGQKVKKEGVWFYNFQSCCILGCAILWKDSAKIQQVLAFYAVTNPNNPTGVILTEEEKDAIVHIAEQFGTYIIVDEVSWKELCTM